MSAKCYLHLLIVLSLTIIIKSISFNLSLNVNGIENNFRFIETKRSYENYQLQSLILLDDNRQIINSSSLDLFSMKRYYIEPDNSQLGLATVFTNRSKNSKLLFAMVQTTNGSTYDIFSRLSTENTRRKRSFVNYDIIRSKNSIIQQAQMAITWNFARNRRDINETDIGNNPTMENLTMSSIENDTMPVTQKPIPLKTRHLYLEITAIVDSLTVNDLRAILNKTELEAIEILKLYYLHVFIGVEDIYKQSLIYETLDVHIRLSKLIFATDKHRLPWELFKNISSITNSYRKSPNNMNLRPNITLDLLKSLHQSYVSNNFDKLYFSNESDHIVTFTRLDLINGAGSAYVLGTCSKLYKYSIIQEDFNLFPIAITVAHELGHNLGLNHDEIENECNDSNFRYIMSPKNMNTVDRPQLLYFSKCSIKQILDFVDNTTTTCWKNKIVSTKDESKLAKSRNIISSKLGQIINIQQQCQLQYGLKSIPFISVSYDNENYTLYEESICKELRCFKTPDDEYIYWQDGAFEGTLCGENKVCQGRKCVSTDETIKKTNIELCPYGDLFVPIGILNLMDTSKTGNMLCPHALNLLRSRGMNVTHLCYGSTLPFYRLCCEECKKHLIPECGDLHTSCSMFQKYCEMQYMNVNGVPVNKLCPYTCGQCSNLSSAYNDNQIKSTSIKSSLTRKNVESTTPKPRKYVKPSSFNKYTCIDSVDCAKLVHTYSKLNKKIKNWCKEYTITVQGLYFPEVCPKYCSICNTTSECDEHQLCRNNGTCIKDKHGTYQCLCSKTNSYYGTLCEYRQTCLDKPCLKDEICIQTQGENYACVSKENSAKLHIILNNKK